MNSQVKRMASQAAAREAGHAANDGDYALVLRIMLAEKEANGGEISNTFAEAYIEARKEG
jgi:hypothetical protein